MSSSPYGSGTESDASSSERSQPPCKRPRTQATRAPTSNTQLLGKFYADTESYVSNHQTRAFALTHIIRLPKKSVKDDPPRYIGSMQLALLTDIKPLLQVRKPNRQEVFGSMHHSNRVHALQRSLYSTPLLLHAKHETSSLSLDQLMFRNRLVGLNLCALRDEWPERFLHTSSFMSNQNASMFCREQSATLVISLESKRCSLHDKQLLERMLQKMQPSMSKPAPQPLQTDTHLCGAYAPEMLQPPRPAPQREPTALDPHKPCYMRFNPDSSSAPNASHHMTDSEFDRHVAADAATKIAWMMERRDLSSNEATALVDEHGEPVSRESHASLYNTVPQLLLPVCDSNLEMISVFAQVYAAARLPLGTVLFKQARRIGAVGPALDSALLQRAALDRLPCFASKSPSLQVQQQRQRISHITYHHAGSKLCLHPATSKMLLSKPFLNRDEHIRLTEHKTTSIGAQDYRAQFEHHVSKLLEPEVRSLQHVICSCSAASQQFCIQGADASKQLMRQASLDALDTWRRAFVLPQRHDMYHAYMDSQQFALRLAATLGSCPGSLHQDAWSREVALSFRSVLLAMPHLLGIAALDSTQFTPQRLSNWWLTADRTAHYIDHVSHRNEEHQVRNTQVGFQEFSLMRVFEEFDANARVAASAASVSMGLDSVECHRMLQTPSDPLTQADSAACRTPLQCLAVHASSMAMLQMSSNAGAANPPSQSPPSLTLSTSGKSSAMRAHRPFDARFDTLHSSPMNQPLLASSPLASYLPFSPWLDALSRHSVLSTSSPLSNSAMARSTFHMISQHTSSN